MEPCKYCSEDCYSYYILSSAPWTRLELDNTAGDVTITAHGDNRCIYKPKFCPECGRRLIREEIEYFNEHRNI